MNPRSPTQFQNGVIDVFKHNKIFDLNIINVVKKGDVSVTMDKELGRKVIKISGNLSPSNNISMPNTSYEKSLNYVGKYYYIFFKAFNDHKFSFQFTFVHNQIDIVRFIFKFPLKQLKISRTNSYNIEIPIQIDENRSNLWSLYKFDPVEFISTNLVQFKDFAALSGLTTESTVLRNFEAFSTMIVRGVYISNTSFSLQSLPKEMSFKGNDTQMLYYFDVCSGEIKEVEQVNSDDMEKVEIAETNVKKYDTEDFSNSMNEINKRTVEMKKDNMQRKKQNIVDETKKRLAQTESRTLDKSKVKVEVQSNYDLKEQNHELLKKNMDNINQEFIENRKEGMRNFFKKETIKRIELLPDPIMHLKYLLGFTAQNCPKIQFNSNGEYETQTNILKENKVNLVKKNIYFTSGSTLVKFSPFDIKQSFFFGHSKPINNFLLACNGEVMFSCQEGKNSIIRVWKTDSTRCIKMLTTPYDKIKVMTESKNSKYLCTVGSEQNKESVILWDINNLDEITVFIKQSSPSPISAMKFSPFEEDILVSCGRENIKFWRIKNDHLSGKAVVLNQYARNTIFLCMDFNNPLFGDEYCGDKGKVFIGSSNGCVFQITCNNQEMEAVYKVQDSSILSISVNDAFCVTGSFDGYLRVWPVDFSEFLIEAKHDSGVCSVDISYDAMDILCGTLNGNIGILNVQNKEYKTILRSPPTLIQKMIAHPSGNYIFTIENDMSVRVWDVEHKSEAFQFLSTKDPPNALAAPKTLVFACGFMSGLLKIFDLEKTEILYECKPFQSHITHIKYIQNDSFLISMSSQGNMSIHDTANNYIQVKLLKIDQAATFTDLSLAVEEDYFATIGPESNCVIVWNAYTFGIKNRVPISNFFVTRLCLVNKNLLAVVLENCSIKFYSLSTYEGMFIKELFNVHINKINQFFVTKNYKYFITGGEEGMIKIWDIKMLFKNISSYQQFIGHSNGVRSIIILENKSLLISASENSGIYFWNFLGDLTFTETEITQELEKLGDANAMKEIMLSTAKTQSQNAFGVSGMNKKSKQGLNTTSNIRIKHMEKVYLAENNPNYEILKKTKADMEKSEGMDAKTLTMLPVIEDKEGVDISYSNTDFNLTHDDLEKFNVNNKNNEQLMSKLLFSSKFLPEKIEHFVMPQSSSNKLSLQFCLGLSVNTMHNLIFNQIDKFYAFTVNNKVIIEFLENERTEVVLTDTKDELSCLALSPDGKYLVAGVGCAYKEEYAAILVYETSQWKLKQKLNFHFRGIQCLQISPNNKYMISIGSKEEKSVCVWNFSNLTVIDSKSVKFVPIDIKCDPQLDVFLYFTSISQNNISFWRMDSNFKLEGFHINIDDLTKEKEEGEYMVSIEMTPYYSEIKTSFIIIGTNKGNILVLDKEKKVVLRKYMISKFPITHIYYFNDSFVCCGEGPIIYHWSFDSSNITSNNVLQFLEKEKANLLLLDSSITSMQLFNGKDGLCTTDTGSIFFINFEEKAAFKIISSHINCPITSIDCDLNNESVLTCGGDGTVRCWTMDSFDQKFQLLKIDQKPEKCLLHSQQNILIIHYDSSYLRLYNLSTLKSLGMIKIPDNNICNFDLIFNNQAILLTTYQEKLFIIDIQNWEPLSVLFSELTISSNGIIPKNQYCKSISCKNITNEKSYAVMSFSDGTVSTICIEKVNGKIETSIVDRFNMIEYHMSKGDDQEIKEMFGNLSNYRSDYKAQAKFSFQFDGVLLCYHESLQFLYIRNYIRNEIIKSIPLNYFPYALDVSEDEKYIAIGTKEGLVLFITRKDNTYASGFNLDIFNGHYDHIETIKFNKDSSKVLTSSYSELFVWTIN